jgi:hypothetical protein
MPPTAVQHMRSEREDNKMEDLIPTHMREIIKCGVRVEPAMEQMSV